MDYSFLQVKHQNYSATMKMFCINFYNAPRSGVFSDASCSGHKANHAVDLIGWGTDPETAKDYWILRNSWDSWWGQNGYGWIERGTNMCGIEFGVDYVQAVLTGN